MRKDAQGRRLCEAHTSKGDECRGPAVNGSKVCRFHGAAAGSPGREAADRLVLAELIGPALRTLKDLLDDPLTPPAVRLHTSTEVLDRTRYSEPLSDAILEAAITAEIQRLDAEMTDDERDRQDALNARKAAFEAAWELENPPPWKDKTRWNTPSTEKPKAVEQRHYDYLDDGTYGEVAD